MQRHTQRPAARSAVSVLAAVALLVSLMATPASAADHPADTDVKGLLKDGYIAFGENKPATEENADHFFPLGEKTQEPSICDPEHPDSNKEAEPRSHVFANGIDANGNSNNLKFHFAQRTTGIKGLIFGFIPYEVCTRLKVHGAGDLVLDTTGKDVGVHVPPKESNEGPLVEIQFIYKNQNNGNHLAVCRTTSQLGQMVGHWEEAKPAYPNKQQHDWNLTLTNSKKVAVPEVLAEAPTQPDKKYDCSQTVADEINTTYGLPRDDGNIEFKYAVYDCPNKDCEELKS